MPSETTCISLLISTNVFIQITYFPAQSNYLFSQGRIFCFSEFRSHSGGTQKACPSEKGRDFFQFRPGIRWHLKIYFLIGRGSHALNRINEKMPAWNFSLTIFPAFAIDDVT